MFCTTTILFGHNISQPYTQFYSFHQALSIDHLQGGIFLQWTLLNYAFYANKTKKLEVTVQFFVMWGFIWYLLRKSVVKFSRGILDWKWDMKVWIILLCTTLVLFSAVLPSCYAASPPVLLVTVGQPSVPSPVRFPSPKLLLGIIKQWDQLPSLFGLEEDPCTFSSSL